MIFDSHCHTEFSADSSMTALEALEAAKKLGLGLVFTEHTDFDFDYDNGLDFTFDAAEYWERYEMLRGDTLRLGAEIGLTEKSRERNREFVNSAPFDFVIGSLHLVPDPHKAGHYLDIYFPETYEGREKEEFYREYFALMAEEIRVADYVQALGHIDYVARYAPYEDAEISYGNFTEEIDAVIKAVLDTGKVMELNTRRLGNRRAVKELAPVYKRYRELGGRYVTLGADAHKAEAIGANFAAALDFAAAYDLEVVTFKNKKMEIGH